MSLALYFVEAEGSNDDVVLVMDRGWDTSTYSRVFNVYYNCAQSAFQGQLYACFILISFVV